MLWIIGNEPDRHLQDSTKPQEYAVLYHDAYHHIKALDPTSHVAIAAVVEPTPLRRQYYDMVLNEYQRLYGEKMPVDVWNIHAFILRESNEWGAGIPPGLEAYANKGMLYDVPDHGDINILKGLIRDFRRWMTERGYQDTPLIVTEYGILLAQDYDAGDGNKYDYAFISRYMQRSFDFFRTARNTSTGYPEDDYRLVQAWSWFGLNNYVYSYPDRTYGFNGNLFEHDSGAMTPAGEAFSAYTSNLAFDYEDLAFRLADISRTRIPAGVNDATVDLNLSVYNRGNVRVNESRIRVWLGSPNNGGTLLKNIPVTMTLGERCRGVFDADITVQLPALPDGIHSLYIEITGGDYPDPLPENDMQIFQLVVGEANEWPTIYVPIAGQRFHMGR